METPENLAQKSAHLRQILAAHPGLIVAYSGGVDSAFLAWAAHQALGDSMRAVIADSPSLARTHLDDALAFAREQSIPVEVVQTTEFSNPAYLRNDAMRCFHCKDELFTVLEQYREAHRADAAAAIAALRQAGLRVWEKPASACLSSRIEYGRPVTPEALAAVERGEDALRALGFRQFRVRHHGEIVRIEIAPDELPRALTPQMAQEFTAIFKALGFKFVTLDLEGFRSGSMNQLLPVADLARGPKPAA